MKITEVIGLLLDEALRFSQASPRAFAAGRDKSSRPSFLSQNDPQELARHNVFVGHSGEAGYALDRNQDLQNVFNNSKFKGGGKQALIHAIKNGATTLDAFDGVLPVLYKKHGFVVTGRMKFNDEFAPAGWDYKEYGRPDVVFMAYRGGPRQTIERRIGSFGPYNRRQGRYFGSYDEAKRVQQAAALRYNRMM